MATVDQNKIRKTCKQIRGFALLILAAIPLFLLWYWANPFDSMVAETRMALNGDIGVVGELIADGYLTPENFTWQRQALGFLVSALPLSLFFLVIFNIYRMMGYFAEGRYITNETVRAFTLASLSLFFYAPAAILSRPLLGLALTLGNPPGQRLLVIAVDGTDLVALFMGAFLWMVAKAFDVEKERAEEHASIV